MGHPIDRLPTDQGRRIHRLPMAAFPGFILALLVTSLATPLAAQAPVVLTEGQGEYPLGRHLEILEDPNSAWSIEDVTSPAMDARFRPSQQEPPNFSFTDSAYWVRFRVRNRSDETSWRLVLHFSHMNHVALYAPTPDGQGFIAKETGNALPFATRDVPHHLFQFRLPSLAQGGRPIADVRVFYLRFRSAGAMILPLKLWAQRDLERHDQLEIFGLGLFYGVMLALIVYNSLLCISLREATYFYHVLHLTLAMLCLASYDGLLQQHLWPRNSIWDPRAIIFFLFATNAAALKFTSTLLKTRTLAPVAHKALVLFTSSAILLTALSLLLPYRALAKTSIIFQLLAYSLIFFVSWVIWRRGYRPARFFLAAWLIFAVGVPILLTLTRIVPILPPIWFNIGLRLGTDGFVLLFSLALADRIHIIRNEREQAQSELLREQRDALSVKDKMNLALQSSRSELAARNAELERYAYTVSHDLKSPVVTIKGFLGLLEKDLAEGNAERRAHHFSRIHAAADKMGRLLDELLDMSRVGHVMGPAETIELSDLATEAVGLVTGPDQDRQLSIEIAPDMPTVSGDRTRLLEVFQNLIENAVKFSRDQITPRIEINARQDGDTVTCSVRDNGIGIEPAYHETAFGLFHQLDPTGVGTGIGLALVKRIVEVHGGKIWVESEGGGHGCTFMFTLPRATETA